MVDLVLERGLEALSLEDVGERAGIPAERVRSLYPSVEACYLGAWEEIAHGFRDRCFDAMKGPGIWRDRLRGAGMAGAQWVNEHRREMRFGVVEMQTAGELAQTFMAQFIGEFVDLIDEGRQELDDPDSLTRSTAEGVAGTMAAVFASHLGKDAESEDVRDWVPELMYFAIRPYVGNEVATEELSRPRPGS